MKYVWNGKGQIKMSNGDFIKPEKGDDVTKLVSKLSDSVKASLIEGGRVAEVSKQVAAKEARKAKLEAQVDAIEAKGAANAEAKATNRRGK